MGTVARLNNRAVSSRSCCGFTKHTPFSAQNPDLQKQWPSIQVTLSEPPRDESQLVSQQYPPVTGEHLSAASSSVDLRTELCPPVPRSPKTAVPALATVTRLPSLPSTAVESTACKASADSPWPRAEDVP